MQQLFWRHNVAGSSFITAAGLFRYTGIFFPTIAGSLISTPFHPLVMTKSLHTFVCMGTYPSTAKSYVAVFCFVLNSVTPWTLQATPRARGTVLKNYKYIFKHIVKIFNQQANPHRQVGRSQKRHRTSQSRSIETRAVIATNDSLTLTPRPINILSATCSCICRR